MCILADNKAGPVVYLDEVEFTPLGPGPHGVLDLLVGIRVDDDMQSFVVIKHNLEETKVVNVNMAEPKEHVKTWRHKG